MSRQRSSAVKPLLMDKPLLPVFSKRDAAPASRAKHRHYQFLQLFIGYEVVNIPAEAGLVKSKNCDVPAVIIDDALEEVMRDAESQRLVT